MAFAFGIASLVSSLVLASLIYFVPKHRRLMYCFVIPAVVGVISGLVDATVARTPLHESLTAGILFFGLGIVFCLMGWAGSADSESPNNITVKRIR
jgi:hypothetical protein